MVTWTEEGAGIAAGAADVITTAIKGTITVDVPAIAANTNYHQAITIAGAALGDFVLVSAAPAFYGTTGISFTGYVSAANTVTVVISNNSAGSINPASGVIDIVILRAS